MRKAFQSRLEWTLTEIRSIMDITDFFTQVAFHPIRQVIRALSRSYGDISIFTRSPVVILTHRFRIFPEMVARTMCLFGNSTRNMVPARTLCTRPSISMCCSLIVNKKAVSISDESTLIPFRPCPIWGPTDKTATKMQTFRQWSSTLTEYQIRPRLAEPSTSSPQKHQFGSNQR